MKLPGFGNMWGKTIFDYVWNYRTLSTEDQEARRRQCFQLGMSFLAIAFISFLAVHLWCEETTAIFLARSIELGSMMAAVASLTFSTDASMNLLLIALIWINMKREQLFG